MARHSIIHSSIACLTVALGADAIFATPASMQALVIGPGGTLVPQAVAKPEPGRGEVRIKVYDIGVNPADWEFAPGMAHPPGPQQIPGWDVAGTIDAIGPSTPGWKVGDAVFAMVWPPRGAYAQYTIASAQEIAIKPQKLSFEEAAGIPTVGVTAWDTLVDIAHLRKGQRILIQGGAGGVGSAAVQIAKALRAYVITTGSARNGEFLRSIGADEVIDYNSTRFEDEVKNVDAVLNTVNEEIGLRSIPVVKRGGILVTIVGKPPTDPCVAARIRCVAPTIATRRPKGAYLADIANLVNEGKYRVNVERVFPLSDAAEAWQMSRGGHTRGKLILRVSQ